MHSSLDSQKDNSCLAHHDEVEVKSLHKHGDSLSRLR